MTSDLLKNRFLLIGLFLLASIGTVVFASVATAEESAVSAISYQRLNEISAKDNEKVAQAHQVFKRLLRSWDYTRVEPQLFVIDSPKGIWAQSQENGVILLSIEALNLCFQNEKQAEDRMAFMLAHELAHQRADHLWTPRSSVVANNKGILAANLNMQDLEKKEEKADQDGLLMMSMVGFNPYTVVDGVHFYKVWVEKKWGQICSISSSSQQKKICAKAEKRAIDARATLRKLVVHATLFELGNQAYVAGNYHKAENYFKAFGRFYSGPSVQSNIGLSCLNQASAITSRLAKGSKTKELRPLLPTVLSASSPFSVSLTRDMRSPKELRDKRSELADCAIRSFISAISLAPHNKHHYINLVAAYLVKGKRYHARAALEEQYLEAFTNDEYYKLLSALIQMAEGDLEKAKSALLALRDASASTTV